MNWVNKLLPPKIKRADGQRKNALPEGLWCKCPNCEAVLYTADLEANMQVCPKCNHHHRLKARARLDMLMDAHGRAEIGADAMIYQDLEDLKKAVGDLYKKRLITLEPDGLRLIPGPEKPLIKQ